IRVPRRLHLGQCGLFRVLVHHHLCPRRRINVPVLLPFIGVRFIEGDLVSPLRECADDSAIVSGRAVPISGDEARAKEGNLHGQTESPRASSSFEALSTWSIAVCPSSHSDSSRRPSSSVTLGR